MNEGILHFLGGGLFKDPGAVLVTVAAAHPGKIQIFDMRHGLAGEGASIFLTVTELAAVLLIMSSPH